MASFLLLATLLDVATAQLNAGSPGSSGANGAFNGSSLCNKTFADANATGIYTINPNNGQLGASTSLFGGSLSNPFTWATTVYQPAGTDDNRLTELSLWLSPGANFSNNYKLGLDICYLWISDATLNTFERGQADNGSCTTMFDDACVQDMNNFAQTFAGQLVGNPTPGPNSNLTANSLPTVCSDLASMMTKNFPKSCEVFFNSTRMVTGGPPGLGGALTGPQSLVSRAACTTNSTYSIMWTQYGGPSLANYWIANYFVAPFITVLMPIADVNRPSTLGYTKSFLNCFRANNVNRGSQSVPPAPSPTPVDTSVAAVTNGSSTSNPTSSSPTPSASHSGSTGLSGGAIAGIVIGVVLGLGLLAALIIVFFFRKRISEVNEKRKSRKIAEMDGGNGYTEMESKARAPLVEAPNEPRMSEVGGGKQTWAELPGQERAGQAVNRYPAELDGGHKTQSTAMV